MHVFFTATMSRIESEPLSNQRLFIGPIDETMAKNSAEKPFFLPSNPDFVRAPWKINGFCT